MGNSTEPTEAGWYHRADDPEGLERWWTGAEWTEYTQQSLLSTEPIVVVEETATGDDTGVIATEVVEVTEDPGDAQPAEILSVGDDDTTTTGDDTTTTGDDTTTNGDDTATTGDDTTTSDNDTATTGDDTATSDNDTTTNGDDTATTGDDTATTGTDTTTSGDDAATTGGDTTPQQADPQAGPDDTAAPETAMIEVVDVADPVASLGGADSTDQGSAVAAHPGPGPSNSAESLIQQQPGVAAQIPPTHQPQPPGMQYQPQAGVQYQPQPAAQYPPGPQPGQPPVGQYQPQPGAQYQPQPGAPYQVQPGQPQPGQPQPGMQYQMPYGQAGPVGPGAPPQAPGENPFTAGLSKSTDFVDRVLASGDSEGSGWDRNMATLAWFPILSLYSLTSYVISGSKLSAFARAHIAGAINFVLTVVLMSATLWFVSVVSLATWALGILVLLVATAIYAFSVYYLTTTKHVDRVGGWIWLGCWVLVGFFLAVSPYVGIVLGNLFSLALAAIVVTNIVRARIGLTLSYLGLPVIPFLSQR